MVGQTNYLGHRCWQNGMYYCIQNSFLNHLAKTCIFVLSSVLTRVIILNILSTLFSALLLPHQLPPSSFYNIFQLSILNVMLCDEKKHYSKWNNLLPLSFISLFKRICNGSELVSYDTQLLLRQWTIANYLFNQRPILILGNFIKLYFLFFLYQSVSLGLQERL